MTDGKSLSGAWWVCANPDVPNSSYGLSSSYHFQGITFVGDIVILKAKPGQESWNRKKCKVKAGEFHDGWSPHTFMSAEHWIDIDLYQQDSNRQKPFTACKNAKFNDFSVKSEVVGFWLFRVFRYPHS